MAVKWLEPGGDADFGIGLWPSNTGSPLPTASTAVVHGSHQRSILYSKTSASNSTVVANSVLADAGGRVSFYVQLGAYPSATSTLYVNVNSGSGTVVRLRATSTGVLQLWENAAQIGTSGPTLSLNTWYRLSFAWTITSTTVNQFRVWVNGTSAISVSNATIANTGSLNASFGNGSGNTSLVMYSSDHYIDDSTALTDTGDIWVTAKRPFANGTANAFTTQIGAGSSAYGSGHALQVNERPNSDTNGWSLSTTTVATEEYNIESAATGDIDVSSATIVGYTGWIRAKESTTANTPVVNIVVNGTGTAKTLTTAAAYYTQVVTSSTYPAGTGTDIGMSGQYTTTAGTFSLYEAGIVIAYTPSTGAATGDIKIYNGTTFVAKPVKAWNGSAWVAKPLKVYNGSAWVVTNY